MLSGSMPSSSSPPQPTTNSIETADCEVSLDVVFDIADALGVSLDRLFDFRS